MAPDILPAATSLSKKLDRRSSFAGTGGVVSAALAGSRAISNSIITTTLKFRLFKKRQVRKNLRLRRLVSILGIGMTRLHLRMKRSLKSPVRCCNFPLWSFKVAGNNRVIGE